MELGYLILKKIKITWEELFCSQSLLYHKSKQDYVIRTDEWHIDQCNIIENPEKDPKSTTNWFATKAQKQFNADCTVFLINGAGSIGDP